MGGISEASSTPSPAARSGPQIENAAAAPHPLDDGRHEFLELRDRSPHGRRDPSVLVVDPFEQLTDGHLVQIAVRRRLLGYFHECHILFSVE